MTRLCRLCGERAVSPARINARDYRCCRCRRRTHAEREVQRRYRRGARGQAINARRIFVGYQYHSRAASSEAARMINTHIKEQRRAFVRSQNKDAPV